MSPHSPQSTSSLEELAKYGVCCVPKRDPRLTRDFQVQDTNEQSMRLKQKSETLRKYELTLEKTARGEKITNGTRSCLVASS